MEEDQILQKTIVHILKTLRVLGCISLGGLEGRGRKIQTKEFSCVHSGNFRDNFPCSCKERYKNKALLYCCKQQAGVRIGRRTFHSFSRKKQPHDSSPLTFLAALKEQKLPNFYNWTIWQFLFSWNLRIGKDFWEHLAQALPSAETDPVSRNSIYLQTSLGSMVLSPTFQFILRPAGEVVVLAGLLSWLLCLILLPESFIHSQFTHQGAVHLYNRYLLVTSRARHWVKQVMCFTLLNPTTSPWDSYLPLQVRKLPLRTTKQHSQGNTAGMWWCLWQGACFELRLPDPEFTPWTSPFLCLPKCRWRAS